MIGLLRAELSRVGHSRANYILPVLSASLVAFTCFSFTTATGQFDMIESGQLSVAASSQLIVSMASLGAFFSAIHGVFLVAPDIRHKVMSRFLQIEPRIWPVVLAKAVVAALTGALIGIVSLGAAIVTAAFLLGSKGYTFVAPENPLWWAGRYVLSASLGGFWGVVLGLIFASSSVAIIFYVIEQNMLEETVIQFFPKVGRWLPLGAQYSLIGDTAFAERFSFTPALALSIGWIALFMVVSLLVARARRDK